jgi:suppressor of ftsI
MAMRSNAGFTIVLLLLVFVPRAVEAQGVDSARKDSAGMAGMSGMSGMSGMDDATKGDSLQAASGRTIVPMIKSPMMPGLAGVLPASGAFSPSGARDVRTLPKASASTEVRVSDGDTVTLSTSLVQRTIGGHTLAMYAFNGEAPGPRFRVKQGATFYVRFRNGIDQPATIHWHGVRVKNAFDGSPGVTQPAVAGGGTFVYAVHCPDAGVFWYHDHVREDIALPMGLYGNIYVEPAAQHAAQAPARTEFLILSDLLLDGDSVISYGKSAPNFALMGRFGNMLLVNGEPRWHTTAAAGEVVRLMLTNVASARTFNISFGDASMKLIASDLGAFTREVAVPSVVIAPGERYVVDVRFDKAGDVAMVNQVQSIDHFLGVFSPDVDTMGYVTVAGRAAPSASFAVMHDDSAALQDIARFRQYFDKAPDEEVVLTTSIHDLPIPVMQFMSVDTLFRPPLEWSDGMSDMNWVATGKEVRWIIRDKRTGAENMNIAWRFKQGGVIKLRIYNDPSSMHPMNHPIHLHGERFLVVARDGKANPYLVWKDTAIIPVGSTVDLLIDLSNPGTWMLHCHIGEHVESGMMATLKVDAS